MELPPLLLFVAWGERVLVGVRNPDGRVSVGMGRGRRESGTGVLLLHWPSAFPWTTDLWARAEGVQERGGAVLPLATVMRRLGLPSVRTSGSLLAAFDLDPEGVQDPEDGARLLVEALARRLGASEAFPAPSATRFELHPEVFLAMEGLPAGPGVYVFRAAGASVLYVGKARSLRRRVATHFGARPPEAQKSAALARDSVRLDWMETGSDLEALLREQIEIDRHRPPLNTQERVHARPRGAWREACALLFLPSAAAEEVEVCLVAGDGRFHWERVPRARRVPQGLWRRLGAVARGEGGGWAPGRPQAALTAFEAKALTEIALGWLSRHGDAVSRIDLRRESPGRALRSRLRHLLGEDPGDRVESRARG